MEEFALTWAAEQMRARIVGADSNNQTVHSISTDSRKAEPGSLFFALKGEQADGHRYVPQALSRGAVAVVAREIETEPTGTEQSGAGSTQLIVEDPLKALGELAAAYRGLVAVKVVGITGSVGKTSTKEMTAHILRSQYRVHASEKNYNNEIGVPLTLFGINRSDDVAVVEMGMRAAGEIRTLSQIAQPDIAIITNIGHAHEELLGSQQAIAEAKAEILEYLPPGGVAILADDLSYSDLVLERLPVGCRTIRVGSRGSDVWAENSEPGLNNSGAVFRVHDRGTGEVETVSLIAPGVHHKGNALLAIAAACELGVPLKMAVAALATWPGADGRMMVRAGLHGVTVLDDCYNAGPESMRSALDSICAFQGRRVAILGDMRELGAQAVELHKMVGLYALEADLHLLITVGNLAAAIAESTLAGMSDDTNVGRPDVVMFGSTADCADRVAQLVQPGDIVLVKGSRAMQMERIVARLVGELISDHHG